MCSNEKQCYLAGARTVVLEFRREKGGGERERSERIQEMAGKHQRLKVDTERCFIRRVFL